MNSKIREHVSRYNASKGWPTTDEAIIETITESEIYRDHGDSHRWWTEYFRVANVDGMLIGYKYAETTGDESARDKGWEFNPNSICEVDAIEKTIIVYQPKRDK